MIFQKIFAADAGAAGPEAIMSVLRERTVYLLFMRQIPHKILCAISISYTL